MCAGVRQRLRPAWHNLTDAASAVALAAAVNSRSRSAACTEEPHEAWREIGSHCHSQQSQRVLCEYGVAGEPSLELWESRFVFLDGAGSHVWPAARCLVAHLQSTSLGTSTGAQESTRGSAPSTWRGRRVLELGCGCGFVATALARWGVSVVAADMNPEALLLAEANASRNLKDQNELRLRHLDWTDLGACAQMREEFGPFDAIVVSDGVLVVPPSGPMWRLAGIADSMISLPGPLLDATRELGHAGTDVIIAVADRAGDVTETARALLERRHWLEIVDLPRDKLADDGSTVVTIFHIRWKVQMGRGAEVTRKLWAAL